MSLTTSVVLIVDTKPGFYQAGVILSAIWHEPQGSSSSWKNNIAMALL